MRTGRRRRWRGIGIFVRSHDIREQDVVGNLAQPDGRTAADRKHSRFARHVDGPPRFPDGRLPEGRRSTIGCHSDFFNESRGRDGRGRCRPGERGDDVGRICAGKTPRRPSAFDPPPRRNGRRNDHVNHPAPWTYLGSRRCTRSRGARSPPWGTPGSRTGKARGPPSSARMKPRETTPVCARRERDANRPSASHPSAAVNKALLRPSGPQARG